MHMRGAGRDIYTAAPESAATTLAEDWTELTISFRREITAVETSRRNEDAQALLGARAGGHMRGAIWRALGAELSEASALHLLLDDHAGASLVATWAWSRHDAHWLDTVAKHGTNGGRNGDFRNICAGFRPGSSALNADGSPSGAQNSARVPPLSNPADTAGWHQIASQNGVGSRRARRTDVWIEDDAVHIDIHFQDSATAPDGGDRIAVHEYRVRATASARELTLLSIEATPHVLPFPECPAAAPNVARLIAAPLADFRTEALTRLPGTLGCTHLNDVMRSMADIPALTRTLQRQNSFKEHV